MEGLDPYALRQATRVLLRPLASLLLKCGMTWREFAELSREVFVQVAGREYGLKGRPTNVARIAILTGIGRREVGKIRQGLASAEEALPNQTTDATRLLSGWHQDAAFGDAGRPLDLEPAGAVPSFAELARRYAPDVPASAILKELRRVGAVVELPGGRLRAMRRYYQPTQLDPQWILNAGSVYADLGANVNHNLAAVPAGGSWFLGRATEERVDLRSVAEFRAFIESEGQAFLERVDAWLSAHRLTNETGADGVRLGAGLFMIKGNPNEGERQ
jgi:hypothetical protein